MAFDSPAAFLTFARERGLLSDEAVDQLTGDPTLPADLDAFLAALRDRGLLATDFTTDPPAPAGDESADPPACLLTDEPTDLPVVVPASHPRHAKEPMSRQTMWAWAGVGAAMWVVGLVVLGLWLGGCGH
jgi:hypothetical protein